jgi:hypothetical protein
MAKLRNTVMAVALGTGVMGCSFAHWSLYHCDECDDFPMPAQSAAASMMPGTYTGPPPKDSTGASPSAISAPSPGAVPPAEVSPASPPTVPAAPRG